MADKEYRITLKINSETNEIKATQKEVETLKKGFSNTSTAVGSFTKGLAGVATALGGLYALSELLKTIYTSGMEYNRTLENLTNGLTTLNVVTSSNISSTGKQLTLQERYALAANESAESIRRLNEINQTTPHTLSETVEIYKAMYPSMRKVGITTEQLYDITQKVSIAAGSAGIQFQQLLAGVDGLASGTVQSNSELGRFLNSLGLTNEELKKADDLYALINSKLKDVQPIENYDSVVSNLKNSFDRLTGVAVEPFFEKVKEYAKSLTSLFDDLRESIEKTRLEMSDIKEVKSYEDYFKKMESLGNEWQELENRKKASWYSWDWLPEDSINKMQKEIEGEISLLKERYKYIQLYSKMPEGSLVGVTSPKESTSSSSATSKETIEKEISNYDAHINKYYEEKRRVETEFLQQYKQSTMTQYELERDTLQKKYDEYKNFTESVAMLDAWRETELEKINKKELEEYKRTQQEKREQTGSFWDGATDALVNYQTQAANAYKTGEQTFRGAMQNMEDALLDFVATGKLSVSDLLNSITRMVLQQQVISPFASSLTGWIGNMFASDTTYVDGWASSIFKAQGGLIPVAKYASGGLLSGGSGLRDDLYLGSASGSHVFAMGGEYIVNQDAVNSLGVNTMDYLNKTGTLPAATTTTNVEIHMHNNTGSSVETSLLGQSTSQDKTGEVTQILDIQMDLINRNVHGSKKFFKNLMGA